MSSTDEIYKISKRLGLGKEDVNSILSSSSSNTSRSTTVSADLYKAGTDYGTVSPKDVYKAGTYYGTTSPKDIYKAGTYYGSISIKDF